MATNAQFAYEYLTAAGLPPEAAAGVVGNLVAESGVNPNGPAGDNGQARGIAQWHPDRWNPFVSWARKAGRDPLSLEAQLYWLKKEAQSPAGGNVWGKLLNVRDTTTAAALWMRLFERPKDQSDANARRRAQLGQAAIKGGQNLYAGPDASLGGAIGNGLGSLIGGAAGAVADPVVTGLQGAASTLLQGAGGVITKGLFVLLAVGLIGAGVVKASGATKLLGAGS